MQSIESFVPPILRSNAVLEDYCMTRLHAPSLPPLPSQGSVQRAGSNDKPDIDVLRTVRRDGPATGPRATWLVPGFPVHYSFINFAHTQRPSQNQQVHPPPALLPLSRPIVPSRDHNQDILGTIGFSGLELQRPPRH